MKIKNKNNFMTMVFVALGLLLFTVNFVVIKNDLIMVLSFLIAFAFPIIIRYNAQKLNKEIEMRFPDFLRDISGNIKAGMTLPQAVMATKKTDYGLLDPFLDRMAVQIDWGVPFDKILKKFSEGKTDVIKRTVDVIDEAIKGGGNISEVLDAVSRSIVQINNLRKERSSEMYSQMLTGYIIFFVFLGVLVALEKFMIPNMSLSGAAPLISYGIIFKQMILIQGFFSGLVIGKMAESNLVSGLKHSTVLMVVGYIALSVFV